MYVIVLNLDNGELLILVTDQQPATALEDYAKRWNIETLFGILKSRGFRLEETHLTDGERINKLLALLTLATIWAFKVGQWLHQQTPLKIKNHGRLTKSIFRYGWISYVLLFFIFISKWMIFKPLYLFCRVLSRPASNCLPKQWLS